MKRLFIVMLGVCAITLSGCAPLVLGGVAATTTLGVNERRTSGIVVEDNAIELKAITDVAKFEGRQYAHINVLSYNLQVLLTGEVPSQEFGLAFEQNVRNLKHVQNVYNELIISEPATLGSRSNDTMITTKVKTALTTGIKTPGFNSIHVKVKTERRVVYLMGIVTYQEAQEAINIVRSVPGVVEVVPLFEVK